MNTELDKLRIDRAFKRTDEPSPRVKWVMLAAMVLGALLGVAYLLWYLANWAMEVEVQRVQATGQRTAEAVGVLLNATGYIVAAHKIQVAPKVNGRVAQVLVGKGQQVQHGQVLVRLEDDDYRAQLQQANGQLQTAQARLQEALHGARPEEIAQAQANVKEVRADLENARIQLQRTQQLIAKGLVAWVVTDDAQARYNSLTAREQALEKAYTLVRLGPRQEQIDSLRGQVEQARGQVAYWETQLQNTMIQAPVAGTILERNVERGEFVTTGFVGERGAKGYVVSLADLQDLQVELDISQNDFAKLGPQQRASVTTDAYPDRTYAGYIVEVAPEANRQKATVQVKVQILRPDAYLRPEMNASVAFIAEEQLASSEPYTRPTISIPSSAVRHGAVFLFVDGRAVRYAVKTGPSSGTAVQAVEGLHGGEALIVNPPASLQDGSRVRQKGAL
ncbi:MAG TPA: efflux RND transporter periplasmic adaptor subunit [Candidatus Saccharimonadia bacterium]|nr:efflux RND transporter periplasmic adaptor subunit [Candidatus Saccharimonadia bacterium]